MRKTAHRRRWMLYAGLLVIGLLTTGCGSERWSPTDPRIAMDVQPTPEVVARVEIDVDVEVEP